MKKVIILLIIIFISLSIVGIIMKDKNGNDNIDNNDKTNVQNEIDAFSEYLFNINIINLDVFGKNYNIETINDDIIYSYMNGAYRPMFSKKNTASKDEINSFISYVFGSDVSVRPRNFWYSDSLENYCVVYDENNEIYVYNEKCNYDFLYVGLNNFLELYENEGKYYAKVVHYYLYDGYVYNNYEDLLNGVNSIYSYEKSKQNDAMIEIRNNYEKYPSKTRLYSFVPDANEFRFYSYEVLE